MANEYIYRKARAGDDGARLAKYIYLTDDYIYPAICARYDDEDWIALVGDCLRTKKNLYSLDYAFVAESHEEIVGAAFIVPCGERLSFSKGPRVPLSLAKRVAFVEEGYFAPLIEENETLSGYNLINICIDESHRGRGVGAGLLRFCLDALGDEDMHLDVIAENAAAIRTYEKCGFAITKKYLGFSGSDEGLPCYHMVRRNDRGN